MTEDLDLKEMQKRNETRKKIGDRLTDIIKEKHCSPAILAIQLHKSLTLSQGAAKHALSAFRNGVFKFIRNIPDKLTRIFVALEVEEKDELIKYMKKLYPDYEYPPQYNIYSIKGLSLYDKLHFLDERQMGVIEEAVENELWGQHKELTLYQRIKLIPEEIYQYMEKEVNGAINDKIKN